MVVMKMCSSWLSIASFVLGNFLVGCMRVCHHKMSLFGQCLWLLASPTQGVDEQEFNLLDKYTQVSWLCTQIHCP